MAKIAKYKKIPLAKLVIGKAQARVHGAGVEIDDLAASIETQGLLQPIVVCEAGSQSPGKWEILAGQRRFLACQRLGHKDIVAAVFDKRVDEAEAKAISITENAVRRRLPSADLKDGIIFLYNQYKTIKDVVAKTGLPYKQVQSCVQYIRLLPELKKMVDSNETDVHTALRAQDASAPMATDTPNLDAAVKILQEMKTMSNEQQKRVVAERRRHPNNPVEEILESAKTPKTMHIKNITLSWDTHIAVENVAEEEEIDSVAIASVFLIEEALTDRGLIKTEA